jgi:hypothetical protein
MKMIGNKHRCTVLKLFPGMISILAILLGSLGLFKGKNKYFTVPVFLILIGTQVFFSIYFKLASRNLFILYLGIALVFILIAITL